MPLGSRQSEAHSQALPGSLAMATDKFPHDDCPATPCLSDLLSHTSAAALATACLAPQPAHAYTHSDSSAQNVLSLFLAMSHRAALSPASPVTSTPFACQLAPSPPHPTSPHSQLWFLSHAQYTGSHADALYLSVCLAHTTEQLEPWQVGEGVRPDGSCYS